MAALCLNSFIKLLKEDTSVFLISNPDFGRYIGELVIFYLWAEVARFQLFFAWLEEINSTVMFGIQNDV